MLCEERICHQMDCFIVINKTRCHKNMTRLLIYEKMVSPVSEYV